MESREKTRLCKTEVPCPGKKEMPLESTRQCMKKTSWAVGEDGKSETKEGKEVRDDVGKKEMRQGETRR